MPLRLNTSFAHFNASHHQDGSPGTPDWKQELGQSNGYYITKDGIEEIFNGCVYYAVNNVGFEYGSGRGAQKKIWLISVFKKVTVEVFDVDSNEFLSTYDVSHPLITALTEEVTDSHAGRRHLRANHTFKHDDISNEEFYQELETHIGTDRTFFFVELRYSKTEGRLTISLILCPSGEHPYQSSADRTTKWRGYIRLYDEYRGINGALQSIENADLATLSNDLLDAIQTTNLIIPNNTHLHLISSLLAKRFLILTGLSGSGKTKLAQALAAWVGEDENCTKLVPVGADWTSRENVLGYTDTINNRYHKEAALELILKAKTEVENAGREERNARPHFLVLDEMNLSHVERYFSDFLSAIESENAIPMHDKNDDFDGVPARMELPINLFVIGTVNVDETTYMFSPKVLDRANAMEFRVDSKDFDKFMNNANPIDLEVLTDGDSKGLGRTYGPLITAESNKTIAGEYLGKDHTKLKTAVGVLHRLFGACGWEFGYRTGKEVCRFVYFHKLLTGDGWQFDDAMDAQIVQKMMPKLNGSEDKLRCILSALAWYSSGFIKIPEQPEGINDGAYCQELADLFIGLADKSNAKTIEGLKEALADEDSPHPLEAVIKSGDSSVTIEAANDRPTQAKYPLTFDKTLRMWRAARANGFTSYAEN